MRFLFKKTKQNRRTHGRTVAFPGRKDNIIGRKLYIKSRPCMTKRYRGPLSCRGCPSGPPQPWTATTHDRPRPRRRRRHRRGSGRKRARPAEVRPSGATRALESSSLGGGVQNPSLSHPPATVAARAPRRMCARAPLVASQGASGGRGVGGAPSALTATRCRSVRRACPRRSRRARGARSVTRRRRRRGSRSARAAAAAASARRRRSPPRTTTARTGGTPPPRRRHCRAS